LGLLHHFYQESEWGICAAFRVNKKNGRTARTFSRRLINDVEAAIPQVRICRGYVGDAEGNVGNAATAIVAIYEFLNRRIATERLEQLYEVRAIADLEQHFAHLICAQHILPMDLREAKQAIGSQLRFQLTALYRDGNVIHK
jgi:hypothetical protein